MGLLIALRLQIMTDFGLSNSYKVQDGLDQSKIFSPLLWRIFYDPLLCEIKRHEHLCGYYIDIQFVARTGKVKAVGRKTFFLAAGAFIDNTIWVRSSQASTQYILNIASEFFIINDISINNDKTVTILINQGVKDVSLLINSLPISIAKKDKSYWYLDIFLSTEDFFKPSLVQAHKNVKFFSNVMLKKTITDKQFFYLVLAVLQPIKSLKAKTALSCDFPNKVLYHSSLYGLKPFKQIQSEGKLASLVFFSNECGIFGCLFEHKFLDLQVLEWSFLNPLQYPVKLCVNPVNNFLAGIVRIFLENELSLVNNLPSAFCESYKKSVVMDWKTFQQWKKLDPRGPVSYWFTLVFKFMNNTIALETGSAISSDLPVLDVLDSNEFLDVHSSLLDVWSDHIEIYTDGSLKGAGSAKITCRAVAYFPAANMSIRIRVFGLLFSTLAELQAIALALECVPASCNVALYSDIKWVKVKGHSGVLNNIKTNKLANKATAFSLTLPVGICEWFLVAKDTAVSGNACHFVHNIYQSICHACWEAGPGYNVILSVMLKEVDWVLTPDVWHPDSHMLSRFISRKSANLCTYLIKAVHRQLPVVVKKRLYNKNYSGVLCLLCREVELPDHVFTYSGNTVFWKEILVEAANKWMSLTGSSHSSGLIVLHSLLSCSLDVSLYTAICKGFVLRSWLIETTLVFESREETVLALMSFIRYVVELHHTKIWLIRSKHKVDIKKTDLANDNGIILGLSHYMVSLLLNKVVCMLSVIEFFIVSFGRHRLCHFFSGLDSDLYIKIDM
ncbi:hypothetical protein G9A89_018618 [Geosiphon pyriformis]|nr:hypothetical protein G9A89_018618 [Geosiphon pyriformis]